MADIQEMQQRVETLRTEALTDINAAADLRALEELRIRLLGKKGTLTELLRGMGSLTAEERPVLGQYVNEARSALESALETRQTVLSAVAREVQFATESLDITEPGKSTPIGSLHPQNLVLNDLLDIFRSMGFDVIDGPEVESDYYNFEALNLPKDHPARDMQDTFFFSENLLLRSQTSTAQIRTMEKRQPPIRVVSPGRVYRADEVDATHSPVFHQMEGLVVDKNITMCDLKGVLEQFVHEIYGADTQVRFRPSFFPFTEPSVEVDVSCTNCSTNKSGTRCPVCKGAGWIEILGAGMVHPNVLKGCGIDPEVYTGFAFGVGIDRLAITRYKISDMRLLFENDVRFLEQFGGTQ